MCNQSKFSSLAKLICKLRRLEYTLLRVMRIRRHVQSIPQQLFYAQINLHIFERYFATHFLSRPNSQLRLFLPFYGLHFSYNFISANIVHSLIRNYFLAKQRSTPTHIPFSRTHAPVCDKILRNGCVYMESYACFRILSYSAFTRTSSVAMRQNQPPILACVASRHKHEPSSDCLLLLRIHVDIKQRYISILGICLSHPAIVHWQ